MSSKNQKPGSKVWVPSSEKNDLPIVTRPQTLPLNKLPWEIFQRLCARLSKRYGDVEFSQEYGLPGQDQDGIDIYIRLRSTGRYSVWQCKRYQDVKDSDIKNAVDEFIDGDWLNKSDEFVLCITVEIEDRKLADEIERQSIRLREKNVAFLPKGKTQLSELLKQHPDLVDDFFNREWAREFCGQEAANQLSHRQLNNEQVVKLRNMLYCCYSQHFEAVDPGLPAITSSDLQSLNPLSLSKRFIIPDILETKQITQLQTFVETQNERNINQTVSETHPTQNKDKARITTSVTEIRKPVINWLLEGNHFIIIGDPGIGKSTLLRYILLDLLSEYPQQESIAIKWGNYLPVWVPFPMWTRMIAENESISLLDVLKAWLNKVSATKDLAILVEQALEDSRLLIFIDGLDEWSNETAARTTIGLLEQFISEKNIPAIATSRPLGFERLGGLSNRWRRSKMAGFTKDQQKDFAYRWFLFRNNAAIEDNNAIKYDEIEKVSFQCAKQFIDDIHKDTRIIKLAEIPLLLSGLITLSIQRVRLPRNRFKAYEELTRILLQEQPQRREKAAQARIPISSINQETKERALAFLAYSIHNSPGSDSINLSSAKILLRDFLVDLLQKLPGEANELAEKILSLGSETMGILVEKSPQEIGFHHRAFQEFLAARYISNKSFDEQKQNVSILFENTQWHDVLLCLLHLNTRNQEVDELIDLIKGISLTPDLFPARQVFLAEVAFSDLHCSAKISSKIGVETFKEIENNNWLPLKERLIERVLDGLFSDVLRADVENQIKQWYPESIKYRSSLYYAISYWPDNKETIDILWKGLYNEDSSNKRAAAESIAKLSREKDEVGDKLFFEMTKPNDPRIISYMLHSFCLGWKNDKRMSKLLSESCYSLDLETRLVGIKHRVLRKEHDNNDRQFLLELISEHQHNVWSWDEDIIDTISIGWPKDREIKTLALKSLTSDWNEGPIDRRYAGSILFKAWPQDDDVARVIAEIFKNEKYPQHRFGFFPRSWDLLIKLFNGNKIISEVIDEWFEKKSSRFLDHEVCLISKSDRAKKNLLQLINEREDISLNPISSLIDGWGIKDPEVSETLKNIIKSEKDSFICHLLPEIIEDKVICRNRLLNYLNSENNFTASLALTGLVKLGSNEQDFEVLDIAYQKFNSTEQNKWNPSGISTLISNFSKDSRVRELALNQIKRANNTITTIAFTYKDDCEIRKEVIKAISSLQRELRLKIVDHLSLLATEDDFVYELISKYDDDTDASIKCKAAIQYARATLERNISQTEIIRNFYNGLQAVGLDHQERRQAAFVGLLELDCIDKIVEAERTESQGIKNMYIGDITGVNYILASQIGKKWNLLQDAFDKKFLDHIDYISNEMLEEIIYQSKDVNDFDDFISKMEKNSGTFSLPALRILEKTWKGTEQLCKTCMNLVNNFAITNWIETSPRLFAAEILSEQFVSENSDPYKRLLETIEKVKNPSAHIIALGKNRSSYSILEKFRNGEIYNRILLPAKVTLHCNFDSSKEFIESLSKLFKILTGDIWECIPFCIKPILHKIQNNEELRNELIQYLEMNPTISDKCNIPQFLIRSGSHNERLRNWCKEEYKRQTFEGKLAEIGFDIFVGHTRSVGHIMLEILNS